MDDFVSRGGLKMQHAVEFFALNCAGLTCCDLGCSTGGFTDCLLRHGAAKVYAVDTGYGVLAWKLRKDARVVVMERQNAMHVSLPEPAALVTIDVAWTKQRHVLPAARKLLAAGGRVVTLIKPHYEAEASALRKGILRPEALDETVAGVLGEIATLGFAVVDTAMSPIKGAKGNTEVLALLAAR